jgi:hypothetical protein
MSQQAPTGCVQGEIVLRIPLMDPTNPTASTTVPLDGITVVVTARGKPPRSTTRSSDQVEAQTTNGGTFCVEGIPSGQRTIWYQPEINRPDGSKFLLIGGQISQDLDVPAGGTCSIDAAQNSTGCAYAAPVEYMIDSLANAAAIVNSARELETAARSTASDISTISQALSGASAIVGSARAIENAARSTSADISAISQTFADASAGVANSALLTSTAAAVQGIQAALQEMATFPYSGPTDGNGTEPPARAKRTPVTATAGIRGEVDAALADLGLTDATTDADLARLFPAETGENGDVTYTFKGPSPVTRSSMSPNGAHHAGDVLISGGLARFHQQAQNALREVSEAFAIVKPLNGDAADETTIATQKAIVVETIRDIVAEPERPDGLRPLAVDAHFSSLLSDPITVDRTLPPPGATTGTLVTRPGNLIALKYLLGIETAVIADQNTELQVTEWQRAEDAVRGLEAAWNTFRGMTNLKLGERLQELDGYLDALAEATDSARNMLRTVRFTVQEQTATPFPVTTGGVGEVTTDDLLTMVDDLAENIGPKYITDWKGRGVGTIAGRAHRLRDIIDEVNHLDDFPFNNARVNTSFGDIVRLLSGTEQVCQRINAGI